MNPATAPSAGTRRNAIVIGGVVVLALIAGLLSAMLLSRPQVAGADASPTPTPPVVSPSEGPTDAPAEPDPSSDPTPVITPQPADEPVAAPSDEPAPVVAAPGDVLPPGSIVRVLVESIKIRTGPTVEAMLLDDVRAGNLVIVSWTYLTQGFGPVEADGFVWYPILDPKTSDLGAVHPPQDYGNVAWKAVGNGTEQWVELVDARCGDGDPDLAEIEGMLAWERVACFGDRQITLQGTYGCGGCGGSIPGTFEPYWLASPMYYEFLSLDPQDHLGPFVLRFSPDGPEHPEAGSIVRVTGHFDDARSSECVVAPGEPTQAVHPSVQELYCRAQFVVDSIEVIGFDESFPLG